MDLFSSRRIVYRILCLVGQSVGPFGKCEYYGRIYVDCAAGYSMHHYTSACSDIFTGREKEA